MKNISFYRKDTKTKSKFFLFYLLILLAFSVKSFAQKPLNPPIASPPKDKIELLGGADSLVGLSGGDLNLRKIYGKEVTFRHKGAIMKCDLAIQDVLANTLQAFGRVKILQGDTLTLTGDTLYYDGRTRFARVFGKKVVLNDRKSTLTTTKIEYDIPKNSAYYPVHGELIDKESTLKSERGYYNTRTKISNFKESVEIINPKYTVCSDSLMYNGRTKIATFKAPTVIHSKDGDLITDAGTYNTVTEESHFRGRSRIENEQYTLVGDTLNFNNATESGIARGNVEMLSKKDKVILNGNVGIREGAKGFTKIYGKALMRRINETDTLFLSADTLYSYEAPAEIKIKGDTSKPKERKLRKLIAEHNVKVFKSDMQSKCDSLLYNLQDSTIHFYKKPILWSGKNQLEADTIHAEMKNNKLQRMYLRVKSFVIAQDTSMNFNQIKGRKITALFDKDSKIENVIVEGNGESIYSALDDKNKLIGVNRVECSRMNLKFVESKVNRIQFTGKPDARLVPPKEITPTEQALEGFNWRVAEKPTRDEVLGKKIAISKLERPKS
jgi:lipopolysaccharide export system protein LptA